MNILLMGLPGAGKGTQAAKIVEKYDFPHISTGDMFRQAIADETELGKKAQSYMDEGGLVPDEVTNGIVAERLEQDDTKKGFMLDGYPRTLNQAEALEDIMSNLDRSIDAVLYFDVDPEVLKKRLSGRVISRSTGETYNIYFNPPKEGIDSDDLYQRDDDKPEVVENRIKVNMEQQQPLLDFYEAKGNLYRIPGDIGIDNVFAKVVEIIEG
ncbi:adenylate kinase [Aerococcus suis]|uniref:Adenylate kinase n=1 Tax=Aerococcus suis TaxID=371602 RepID=A0A1W1Z2J8_9LACT|nr:adenylate kinase [Aerococcus suis]MDY4646394.1 adenylate kinase [Aerococcus suis]SMC42649.1 Adenylate kinase [Aerococcus suis]